MHRVHNQKANMTFIDDYSRYHFVLPMKRKSDIFNIFKQFKAFTENQTERKIKILQDSKEGEYMSNAMLEFTNSYDIKHQHTVRACLQQNGITEWANCVLSERITAMLKESGLAMAFWGKALAALVHVWNRCPTNAHDHCMPYKLWNGHKPDVFHLRVWRYTAYVHLQQDKGNVLQPHYEKCVFIGYPSGYKGWKFYNPTMKHTIISEYIDFNEWDTCPVPIMPSSPALPANTPYVPPNLPGDADVDEPAPDAADMLCYHRGPANILDC